MTAAQSPLFEPVLWQGRGFKILDEIQVPERIEYIAVSEVSQALDAVKDMRTRAFGQVLTFLYAGALLAQNYRAKESEPLRTQLAQMTQRFCDARPTFDFKGLGDYFYKWFDALPRGADAGDWIANQAREFGAQIIKARRLRARRTAAILPNPVRLLTHCNVSGELVAVAHACRELGKDISVLATETRPYLQGTRLTAWELAKAGVAVSLIPDCAVAQVMAKRDVTAVLVGSDRCARNGDIINKVGTYPLALMAREYGMPFFALVQDPGSVARGSDLEIEERSAGELLSFQGRSLIPNGVEGIAVRYPAFDVTPAALITTLIGFDDLYTPESFRKKYQREATATDNSDADPRKYLLLYGLPKPNSYGYLAQALKAERAESVLVPEMRPELRGAQVVAPALLKQGVPTTLISDNMMGTLFAHGQIERLVLFYSGLSEPGPIAICGSLLAARLARAHGIPVELLEAGAAQEASPDRDVSTFLGEPVSPPEVSIYPIQPDVIPWELLKENSGSNS
jgi:methylthioribose-1-phosphate isomerase